MIPALRPPLRHPAPIKARFPVAPINSPPACSGDAVGCGAARTQWATTCQLHKDLTGDGAPADFTAFKTAHTQSEVWSTATAGNTVGDQANAGNYNSTGFAYGTTCPLTDLTVSLWQGKVLTIPFTKGCVVGPWIRGMLIAMALFSAAIITKGGNG